MDEILTVSELTSAIKKQLESRFSTLHLKGEISNFKEQSSGHLYFTLKDAESQISAVLFRGNTRHLARLPKGGDQVIVKGELSVYAPKGNYQLIIRELQYAGLGELLLKLQELKSRLQLRGWFDPQLKKQLPKMPKTIGIVTSPTGAVIQDILHVLNRRFAEVHVILNPVKVQGEGSAEEIADAIDFFNTHSLADVLIVGRGGGSLEDLWAFNEEILASAIYRSKIPVISAVGHETDFSIADFVADLRAPTPSAAAELVVPEKKYHLNYLNQMQTRVLNALQHQISIYKHRLEALSRQPVFCSPYGFLEQSSQKIDEIEEEISNSLKQKIEEKKAKLVSFRQQLELLNPTQTLKILQRQVADVEKRMREGLKRQIEEKKERLLSSQKQLHILNPTQRLKTLREKLERLSSHLSAIDPRNLLKKGFSILLDEKGESIILSKTEVHNNQPLRIKLSDGDLKVKAYDI